MNIENVSPLSQTNLLEQINFLFPEKKEIIEFSISDNDSIPVGFSIAVLKQTNIITGADYRCGAAKIINVRS